MRNLLENQQAAESVDGIYIDLESRLMQNIAKHLRDWKQPIDSDEWLLKKLAEVGKLNKENIKIIAEMSGLSFAETERLLKQVAEETLNDLEPGFMELAKKGYAKNAVAISKSKNIKQIMYNTTKQAKDKLSLTNTTMLHKSQEAFRHLAISIARESVDIMNKNAVSMITGAEARQQVLEKAIKQFAQKGITGFVDKRGREWTPEAYINMVLRTTAGNVAHEVQDARQRDYGIKLVEISSHSGARPKCARDQGKIYALDNTSGVTTDAKGREVEYFPWSSTSYGEPDGLLGINCRHHKFSFVAGVSIQRYFPTEDMEENNRLYKQTQVQRAMERDIRKQKRECMLYDQLGDKKAFEKSSVVLKQKEKNLEQYIEQHEFLHRRKDREKVVGYSQSISARAVAANKYVQKALAEKARNDKIKAGIKAAGIKGEITIKPDIPDLKEVLFDNSHANEERGHIVTAEEAKSFIKNAKFSTTRWNGEYTDYFSEEGAAYLNNKTNTIRTAYKKDQFDEKVKKAMEVFKDGQ